ncbi:MAG: DUF6495 family protein [Cyclobacteriaceae bacterium]
MAINNYRRLTIEELEPLEKEFVDFLVVNGITAPDWVKLKEETPEKGEEMVDLFSEVVFEGIFRKVKFLEIRSNRFIHAYQCLENKMILVGMESSDPGLDLSKGDLHEITGQSVSSISLFMTEKPYDKKREHELYDMTVKGCEISEGQLFKQLSLAYINNRNG